MTLGEFKAWLDGFQEALGDKKKAPTQKQWTTIQEKLATVTPVTVTWPTYIYHTPSWPNTYTTTTFGLDTRCDFVNNNPTNSSVSNTSNVIPFKYDVNAPIDKSYEKLLQWLNYE